MATKWMVFLVFCFILLTIGSAILEDTTFGDESTGLLHDLMTTPEISETTNPLNAVWVYATFAWTWIQGIWKMLWFDYSFFQGQWAIVRFLFISISIGMVWSIILAIRGTSSA